MKKANLLLADATLMASDNIAPAYGNHQLEAFFNQQAKQMNTHPSHNKEAN